MNQPSAVDTLPQQTVKAGVIAMLHRLPDDVTL
jgi:hypothetical protein